MNGWANSDLEILRELAEGKTNKEVAERVGMAVESVRKRMLYIAGRLGLDYNENHRAKIVSEAIRKGVIR